MGKGGGEAPPPQVIQPDRPFIPGEQELMTAGLWRTLATTPWTSSPYRSMDFLFGLPSPGGMQVPQFQPPQGMAQFNPGYGGGYGPGGMPGGGPAWPMFLPPALSYAGGGGGPKPMAPQMMPQGQPQQQPQGQQQSGGRKAQPQGPPPQQRMA